MNDLAATLILVSTYIVLLPLLVCIVNRKQLNTTQRKLALVIYAGFIAQLASKVLWHLKINNLALFHIYPLINLVLLSVIYRRALRGFIPTWAIPLFSGGVILFSVFNTMIYQSILKFSSNAITIVSALLIIYAISYFLKLLREPARNYLEREPMFWINCGVLIYFSGSLFIFMYSNYMLPKSKEVQGVLWGVHAIFNIIIYLLYTIALWVREKS